MVAGSEIYNQSYKDKYLAQAATPLGKAIYYGRWALITRHIQRGSVLDYGSGPGAFNACGPDTFKRFNYDINPTCEFTQRVWEALDGPVIHSPGERIDVLTMWDSIEHIPNFYGEIKDIDADWVFISTPNIMACTGPVEFEKHLRLKEHIHHFEPYGLQVIFEDMGYELLETNYDEGKLRDVRRPNAIFTQVYRKLRS